jgi:hypothetical protein
MSHWTQSVLAILAGVQDVQNCELVDVVGKKFDFGDFVLSLRPPVEDLVYPSMDHFVPKGTHVLDEVKYGGPRQFPPLPCRIQKHGRIKRYLVAPFGLDDCFQCLKGVGVSLLSVMKFVARAGRRPAQVEPFA